MPWFAYIKSLSFHCNKYTIWNTFSTENNYEITWWKVKHEFIIDITGSMFKLKLKFHMAISDQPILFLFCKITVTIQVLTVQLAKRKRNVPIQILLPWYIFHYSSINYLFQKIKSCYKTYRGFSTLETIVVEFSVRFFVLYMWWSFSLSWIVSRIAN